MSLQRTRHSSPLIPTFCPRRPSSPGEPAAPFSPCEGNADGIELETILQDVGEGHTLLVSDLGFPLSSLPDHQWTLF